MNSERDAQALDELAAILRRPTWPSGADFMEWCAQIVAGTGRDLQNGETDDGSMVLDGALVDEIESSGQAGVS